MKTVLEIHHEICDNIKEVYEKKNADYGNSFAIARKKVPFYTLGKLFDKFSRYENLTLNNGKNEVEDESIEDTLLDMANYCIMELAERYEDTLPTLSVMVNDYEARVKSHLERMGFVW